MPSLASLYTGEDHWEDLIGAAPPVEDVPMAQADPMNPGAQPYTTSGGQTWDNASGYGDVEAARAGAAQYFDEPPPPQPTNQGAPPQPQYVATDLGYDAAITPQAAPAQTAGPPAQPEYVPTTLGYTPAITPAQPQQQYQGNPRNTGGTQFTPEGTQTWDASSGYGAVEDNRVGMGRFFGTGIQPIPRMNDFQAREDAIKAASPDLDVWFNGAPTGDWLDTWPQDVADRVRGGIESFNREGLSQANPLGGIAYHALGIDKGDNFGDFFWDNVAPIIGNTGREIVGIGRVIEDNTRDDVGMIGDAAATLGRAAHDVFTEGGERLPESGVSKEYRRSVGDPLAEAGSGINRFFEDRLPDQNIGWPWETQEGREAVEGIRARGEQIVRGQQLPEQIDSQHVQQLVQGLPSATAGELERRWNEARGDFLTFLKNAGVDFAVGNADVRMKTIATAADAVLTLPNVPSEMRNAASEISGAMREAQQWVHDTAYGTDQPSGSLADKFGVDWSGGGDNPVQRLFEDAVENTPGEIDAIRKAFDEAQRNPQQILPRALQKGSELRDMVGSFFAQEPLTTPEGEAAARGLRPTPAVPGEAAGRVNTAYLNNLNATGEGRKVLGGLLAKGADGKPLRKMLTGDYEGVPVYVSAENDDTALAVVDPINDQVYWFGNDAEAEMAAKLAEVKAIIDANAPVEGETSGSSGGSTGSKKSSGGSGSDSGDGSYGGKKGGSYYRGGYYGGGYSRGSSGGYGGGDYGSFYVPEGFGDDGGGSPFENPIFSRFMDVLMRSNPEFARSLLEMTGGSRRNSRRMVRSSKGKRGKRGMEMDMASRFAGMGSLGDRIASAVAPDKKGS